LATEITEKTEIAEITEITEMNWEHCDQKTEISGRKGPPV
jgi:hypothetical protein